MNINIRDYYSPFLAAPIVVGYISVVFCAEECVLRNEFLELSQEIVVVEALTDLFHRVLALDTDALVRAQHTHLEALAVLLLALALLAAAA